MNNIGEYLKNTRIAKNFSIEDVAEATGIRAQYLDALEKGDYTKIPGDVFIKGFIRNYGNYLGVNGNELVDQYKRRNQDPSLDDATVTVKKPPEVKRPADVEKILDEQQPEKKAVPYFMKTINDTEEEPAPRKHAAKNYGSKNYDYQDAEEPKRKTGLPGAWQDLKDFVIDNIYETVDDDDDEDDYEEAKEPKKYAPVKEEMPVRKATGKSSFFNMKVFGVVFAVCMVIFFGVMGYFMLASKTSNPINVDTGFNGTVKSAHSTEKPADKTAADKEKKEDEKTTEEDKTEDKKDAKTLGTGEGVTVEVSVLKPCWTQVTADGKTLEAATLQPGVTRIYKGSKEVKINVGSIRYVKIKVNGKEVPVTNKEWGEATKVFRK